MKRTASGELMLDVRISVKGPGGCICGIVNDLEVFLKSKGHDVTVIDDHPYPGATELKPWDITLVALHDPWGG